MTSTRHPRLFVVRHGETEWSRAGRHTGRSDPPLTGHGEDEARALAPCLRGIAFSYVFSSLSKRARRTCELTQDLTPEMEPDLMEWDYGDYEGKSSKDIREERPGWSVFRDGCPGGETSEQIRGRVDRVIAHLTALTGNIVLFTHGQFALALAARWIGLPVADGLHFLLDTASLSILGDNPDHPSIRVVELWNFTPQSRWNLGRRTP